MTKAYKNNRYAVTIEEPRKNDGTAIYLLQGNGSTARRQAYSEPLRYKKMKKKFLYRDHNKGGLGESLETIQEMESFTDIFEETPQAGSKSPFQLLKYRR